MGSRDHSVECERCGASYGGMNDDSEEHECGEWADSDETWARACQLATTQRDSALSALRRLLPLLDKLGMTTHEEQAAIREARIIAGERP